MMVGVGLLVVEVRALVLEFILFSKLVVFELVLIFDRRDLLAVDWLLLLDQTNLAFYLHQFVMKAVAQIKIQHWYLKIKFFLPFSILLVFLNSQIRF